MDISKLQTELEGLVRGVPAFAASGFSSFDINDVTVQTSHQSFPFAGVMYDGAIPVDRQSGNTAVPVADKAHAVTMITVQFTVVIAIQYHYAGQDDTKPQATSLLDDLRPRIMGYKGVNTRPWRFTGEKPEAAASGDGLSFYSQVWQTTVSCTGNFNNT